MSNRRYLKPPWFQRNIINHLLPILRPSLISTLSVPGRRSGRWHTVPIALLETAGERYLVSYRGESDWAKNLRSSKSGRLRSYGRTEEITVSEVAPPERAVLLEEYRASYGRMPTVSAVLRALPDPADHPTFRIEHE
jgi:hypothetical protein